MHDTYVIIWTAKYRDGSGVGTKRFSKADAESIALELNQEHPEFIHQAIDSEAQPAMDALAQLRQSVGRSKSSNPDSAPATPVISMNDSFSDIPVAENAEGVSAQF